MADNTFHLLNGDSLREAFPQHVEGEIIVFRECLVDGPVSGSTFEELMQTRAEFIAGDYDGYGLEDYHVQTVSELKKITDIPDGSIVNLWFEDDLFCQVNFWCAVSLLRPKNVQLFLVRPDQLSPYGFAAYTEEELRQRYRKRSLILQRDQIAELWKAYQQNDTERMLRIGSQLNKNYPFIHPAIEAHIDRIPTDHSPGRPKETLLQIMKELDTDSFGPVFQEFCKRETVYGFGDLQVKRLFDEVKDS